MIEDKIKVQGDQLRLKLVKGDGKVIIRAVKEVKQPPVKKTHFTGTFTDSKESK